MTQDISGSRGLADWLIRQRLSFACTSYQTGQLVMVGAHDDGAVAVHRCLFDQAMGLCWRPGRLYVASRRAIWRLENVLAVGERGADGHDLVLVPRNAQYVGDLDTHELGVAPDGRILFVNTRYSCLATTDTVHSFAPVWTPGFISRLAPEDRCHLNGLAMDAEGRPAFASSVSRSDLVAGWREQRRDGGVILDLATGEAVLDGLSMPHSPRIVGKHLYFLESGRGYLARWDRETGERQDIAFCPGFLRGLAIHGHHALVTVSMPREQSFAGLPIDEELARRGGTAWCGVLVIDLRTGDLIEWLRFHGALTELFDVAILPGIGRPMAIGPESPDSAHLVTMRVPAGAEAPSKERVA